MEEGLFEIARIQLSAIKTFPNPKGNNIGTYNVHKSERQSSTVHP